MQLNALCSRCDPLMGTIIVEYISIITASLVCQTAPSGRVCGLVSRLASAKPHLSSIILVALMLSHLLVHLPLRPLRSQIALFSMPRLISGINFHLHFVNQFHLFMLTSTHPSFLLLFHPQPLHNKLKTYLSDKSLPPQISP